MNGKNECNMLNFVLVYVTSSKSRGGSMQCILCSVLTGSFPYFYFLLCICRWFLFFVHYNH